jgi:predicted Rossmann fold flavoprotein
MQKQRVGIIGAGPAGIMAALEAVRYGAHVLLFDSNMMVGRKIHVTGNGRCNISNVDAAPERYTCADRAFLGVAFARHGHSETVARLDELGIPTYTTPDGWCYPLSNSAATVANALATQLDLAGVNVHLQHKIGDIRRDQERFFLAAGAPSQTYSVDRLVVACGGKAYPALGSTGELFPLLERLGHTVNALYPALAPITGDVRQLHKLQGVRLDVGLTLLEGEHKIGETVGNLMFTQLGFSGPAVMDLSHLISTRPDVSLTLVIDLVPFHRERLSEVIARFRSEPVPLAVILGSVMAVKIPPVVIPLAGLPVDVPLSALSQKELERLLHLITHLEVQVSGTREFKFSQLSTGGIPVTEVDPRTMASRVVPGLYFAGEVLDVVGPCGGYNLQWCWTSGAIAGIGTTSTSAFL